MGDSFAVMVRAKFPLIIPPRFNGRNSKHFYLFTGNSCRSFCLPESLRWIVRSNSVSPQISLVHSVQVQFITKEFPEECSVLFSSLYGTYACFFFFTMSDQKPNVKVKSKCRMHEILTRDKKHFQSNKKGKQKKNHELKQKPNRRS